LLERAPEWRAVGVRRAEVGVPRVEVGIEMDEGDRAMTFVGDPQERQRDRVIATEDDESIRALERRPRADLDLGDGLDDVERVRREVARVRDLLQRPGLDVESWVIGAQELGAGADRRRAESRSGAVGDAGVERDPEDR